jgi:D-alanyl-D-alanine carboxypeptidase
VVLLSIIIGVVYFVKEAQYKKSYEYKLLEVGYTQEETTTLIEKYDNNRLEELLNMQYNEHIVSFMEEKYFIFSKLNDYLAYKEKYKKKEYNEIVQIVNVEMHIDWLDNQKETDTSKNELMLVNRIYGLSEDYVPSDLVDVPIKYAYAGKKLSNFVLQETIKLIEEAKNYNYNFVVSDGYRSYEDQKKMYDSYVDAIGVSETDEFVARPGHSEHQSGLILELKPYNKVISDVSTNEEYLWLRENAHKFGFIFRYNKEHEKLTGFSSFTWKIRYVGVEAATTIYNEGICFEEYYAYYVGE